MKVSACIATRGDVDMQPIVDSLPPEWETIVWDNGTGTIRRFADGEEFRAQHLRGAQKRPDLSAHARFAAIEYASHDLIYVQDDDVIVSDPQAIVDAWIALATCDGPRDCVGTERGCIHCYPTIQESIVCNMPQEFRPHYPDSAMVGFGAAFHRDAPERAFQRFFAHWPKMERDDPLFLRESCRIFTTLTPRVLVDVPKEDMPYCSDENRLWKDPKHTWYRDTALKMAREARDA